MNDFRSRGLAYLDFLIGGCKGFIDSWTLNFFCSIVFCIYWKLPLQLRLHRKLLYFQYLFRWFEFHNRAVWGHCSQRHCYSQLFQSFEIEYFVILSDLQMRRICWFDLLFLFKVVTLIIRLMKIIGSSIGLFDLKKKTFMKIVSGMSLNYRWHFRKTC